MTNGFSLEKTLANLERIAGVVSEKFEVSQFASLTALASVFGYALAGKEVKAQALGMEYYPLLLSTYISCADKRSMLFLSVIACNLWNFPSRKYKEKLLHADRIGKNLLKLDYQRFLEGYKRRICWQAHF